MEWSEWEITEDDYGVYKNRTNELGIIEKLTEYKQKYWDENPPVESETQPTETELLMDYVIDVDYRVTMIELGL